MSIYKQFCREELDERGVLRHVELICPEDFNFGYDVVDAIAKRDPEKRALVWCDAAGQERFFSFEDVRVQSDRAAQVLQQAGIGKGHRVMVILKRHYLYWMVAVALHKLGVTMIPATHMLTVKDLVYRLGHGEVQGVICTHQDDVPGKVRQALEQLEQPDCKLWCVGNGNKAAGFTDLMKDMEQAQGRFVRPETSANDPMLLYFTSGTTGQPKGVIHDFRYPLAHIVTAKYWQQAQDGGLHFTVAETGWAKASWGKLYGQWLVGSAVMAYDFDHFDPQQLTDVINRYGVTSFCAPPTVYRYLVRKGIPEMPALRHASTAGEKLSPEVFRRFTQKTGIPLCEGYGQTETALLMANFGGQQPVEGSMGAVSPLYNIALWGKDGKPVPAGEIGEVVILPEEAGRAPGVFRGYLGNEEQYRHVWRGGAYHTGDAAWQDEDGRYWFHGRFDDIIKTGGFRVGPDEIESVLHEHPMVQECSVIGVPAPLRGQEIQAVVVLRPGCAPDKALEQEIRDFCNSRLAEYKWVRSISFVDMLPKTISGKVRRTKLRQERESAL